MRLAGIGTHLLRHILNALVGVLAGCSFSGPITSTLMLNGDEAFLPTVGDFTTGQLADAPEGLALRPGDVLFLSQQTCPPAGKGVGEKYGLRSPSDLGTLRLPLRKVGGKTEPTCTDAADLTNLMGPSERLVISTVLSNARQRYVYDPLYLVENSGKELRARDWQQSGLEWADVKNKFRDVMDNCGGLLWNKFVDSLRVHALAQSQERILVSIDLEALRTALPEAWPNPLPGHKNPNALSPRDVFGYLFIDKYTHGQQTGNTRMEISTLNGPAFSTFGHVLQYSEDQRSYGKVFSPDAKYKSRFTPRHTVLLNGVDFRSDDLDREEMHWSLKEVEDSEICVGRDGNNDPVDRYIISLNHYSQVLVLFDDRKEGDKPETCAITVGIRSPAQVGWKYTINRNAIQELAVGQTVTETFTIKFDFGNKKIVPVVAAIMITGTIDEPVISIANHVGSNIEKEDGEIIISPLSTIDLSYSDYLGTPKLSVAPSPSNSLDGQFKAKIIGNSRSNLLGPEYFDYPLESPPKVGTDYGNAEDCGPRWLWKATTGHVARAKRVLNAVPIHSVSELTWSDELKSNDQKPSLSERCLVK